MKICKLTNDAYKMVTSLKETLLKEHRGYGIVTISYNNLLFGIPFRSNLQHKHGFKTVLFHGQWSGLDYSKAILVTPQDLCTSSYKLSRQGEYAKVKKNKDKIIQQFEKYVRSYISCVRQGKIPSSSRFGFTTLQNYHKELGL